MKHCFSSCLSQKAQSALIDQSPQARADTKVLRKRQHEKTASGITLFLLTVPQCYDISPASLCAVATLAAQHANAKHGKEQ